MTDTTAAPRRAPGTPAAEADVSAILPLLEEELHIEKRSVVTGKVQIRTVVETVQEMARATLDEEQVQVTRVPIEREVTERPAVRQEGDVLIVPLIEEVLVVEKRLVLREELHIRKLVTREDVEVPVTLRHERGVVERVSAGPDPRVDEETAP